MYPSVREVISCPMNNVLVTMAMSVPRPRFCWSGTVMPFLVLNWKKEINVLVLILRIFGIREVPGTSFIKSIYIYLAK